MGFQVLIRDLLLYGNPFAAHSETRKSLTEIKAGKAKIKVGIDFFGNRYEPCVHITLQTVYLVQYIVYLTLCPYIHLLK